MLSNLRHLDTKDAVFLSYFVILSILTPILAFISAAPCQSPTNGVNTKAVHASPPYVYQSVYEYECIVGYVTSDDMVSTCQGNGTWSTSPPTCTGEIIISLLPS